MLRLITEDLAGPLLEPQMNTHEPTFTALGHGDNYLASGDVLADLLDEVQTLDEDSVIWSSNGSLAAIVARGKATVLDKLALSSTPPTRPTATPSPRGRGKSWTIKRKRKT
jgi:hypothetical protein